MRDEENPREKEKKSLVLGLSVDHTALAARASELSRRDEYSDRAALSREAQDDACAGHGRLLRNELPGNARTYKFKRRDGCRDDESTGTAGGLTATEQGNPPAAESRFDIDFERPSSESTAIADAEGLPVLASSPPSRLRQPPVGTSGKEKRLISELIRLPSQRFWQQPVTVSKPKSVLRRARLWCGRIVENPKVQVSIILLIILNAILMGVATFDFVSNNPSAVDGFEATDLVFLIIFTIELALQLFYRFLALFKDGWLVFDFAIVVSSWSLESLQVVRAFRSFRAFRLVTRIGPLRDLIAAIGAVMPRMYAIALLLLLVFYIFAVLFTELFGDLELSDNYFTSLDASLFTCMELMTLEWADVARQVMEQLPWAWAPIIAFIAITGFIVFNLIVAVVCDAVAVVDREARAAEEKRQYGETESDRDILDVAQTRIWELSDDVQAMKRRQMAMQQLLHDLAREITELQSLRNEPLNGPTCIGTAESDEEGRGSDEDSDSEQGNEGSIERCETRRGRPAPSWSVTADAAPEIPMTLRAEASGTSDSVSKPTEGGSASEQPSRVSAKATKRSVSFEDETMVDGERSFVSKGASNTETAAR